jgi:hypothetical protein
MPTSALDGQLVSHVHETVWISGFERTQSGAKLYGVSAGRGFWQQHPKAIRHSLWINAVMERRGLDPLNHGAGKDDR